MRGVIVYPIASVLTNFAIRQKSPGYRRTAGTIENHRNSDDPGKCISSRLAVGQDSVPLRRLQGSKQSRATGGGLTANENARFGGVRRIEPR